MCIDKNRLIQIKENATWQKSIADKILEGDRDNYDGADGARYIKKLCCHIEELLAALEQQKSTNENQNTQS